MTKSEKAKELGFRTSFLEHLCERQLYKRDDKTNRFNETYITQLVRNYRSHPVILKLSNELFYDNSLIPMASEGMIRLLCLFSNIRIHVIQIMTTTNHFFYRCYWLVCEFVIIAIKTISHHLQVRSILQCRTIRGE